VYTEYTVVNEDYPGLEHLLEDVSPVGHVPPRGRYRLFAFVYEDYTFVYGYYTFVYENNTFVYEYYTFIYENHTLVHEYYTFVYEDDTFVYISPSTHSHTKITLSFAKITF